jgi:hypothetical protein
MKALIPFLATPFMIGAAFIDLTPYQTYCGMKFAPGIDSTKVDHICKLAQMPQYQGLLKKVRVDHDSKRAMAASLFGDIYVYESADRYNPKQLDQAIIHELSHLLHDKLIQAGDPLVKEFEVAWQTEGGMQKPNEGLVGNGYSSSSIYEGFAEAMRFVVYQDAIADQYPKQKAIILKILARYY